MHEPQIGTHNRFIYMLTVGRVITTNVSQINLGQLLSRVTLKAELGYRLMFVNALGTNKFDCAKINAHFTGGGGGGGGGAHVWPCYQTPSRIF